MARRRYRGGSWAHMHMLRRGARNVSSVDPSLTLSLDFVNDQTLTPEIGPELTFARSSSAHRVNSSGQLELMSSDEPRWEHDKDGNPIGLRVEEYRTNYMLHSNGGANWAEGAHADPIDENYAEAPDGTMTASRIISDNAGGAGAACYATRVVTGVGTTTQITVSVYLKADQSDWVRLLPTAFTGVAPQAYFNLATGTVGTSNGPGNDDQGMEDVGNGWYRCWVTFTTAADQNGSVRVYVAAGDGSATVSRSNDSSVLYWGVQVERGAYMTSYIPTAGSTATRQADSLSSTDVSWFNEDGIGSWYLRATTDSWPLTHVSYPYRLTNGSGFDLHIRTRTAGSFEAQHITDGDDGFVNVSVTPTPGVAYEFATGMAEDDFPVYYDGSLISTDPSVDLDNINDAGTPEFRVSDNYYTGLIQEIRYYNERKDDATLLAMSEGVLP